MTTPPPVATKKRRLGEILQDAGLISEVQLKAALSEQRKWGGKLGRTLVEMGFVDEEGMAAALSRQLNLPLIDLDRTTVSPEVTQFLRVDMAERYGVFPVAGDAKQRMLQIATSDPSNLEAIQELAFNTGMRIAVSVAGPTAIERAIRAHYYGERTVDVPTASPAELGMSEQSFDVNQLSAAPEPAPDNELHNRLAALEKSTAAQASALRILFDVLIDKGLITREEYAAKARARQQAT